MSGILFQMIMLIAPVSCFDAIITSGTLHTPFSLTVKLSKDKAELPIKLCGISIEYPSCESQKTVSRVIMSVF